MRTRHRLAPALALATALVLTACGSGSSPDAGSAQAPTPTASPAPTTSSPDEAIPSPTPTSTFTPPDITSQEPPEADPRWGPVPASQGVDPARIRIPSIGVDADVIDLGLNGDGTLEVPQDFSQTGWFAKGSKPGQYGASVIAGHIDSTSGPAVFFRLDELVEGDEVMVEGPDGDTVTFRIETVEQFSKDAFPTQRVYSFTEEPTIRLVTCGGPFNDTIGHYEDNVIAFARRVPADEA